MNLIIIENIIISVLLALAFACVVTFVSVMYEDFMSRRRLRLDRRIAANVIRSSFSHPKPKQPSPVSALVRGYDSQELFREDLWLRRLHDARKELAALRLPPPRPNTSIKVIDGYGKQVCVMLAQHGGARCNN